MNSLTECDFAFIPSEGPPNLRITLNLHLADQSHTEVEHLVTAATATFNTSDDSTVVDARIVVANNTLQAVNGSFCHIASLEVYRGKRQITVINHNGFSLSDRGATKVCFNLDNFSDLYNDILCRIE